ncbi:hypothetical protein Bbelb_181720 [Branchiostoma belcheri]|nr:hypothetical protein Bbelb_181720 [Branchiostoma belcheri]
MASVYPTIRVREEGGIVRQPIAASLGISCRRFWLQSALYELEFVDRTAISPQVAETCHIVCRSFHSTDDVCGGSRVNCFDCAARKDGVTDTGVDETDCWPYRPTDYVKPIRIANICICICTAGITKYKYT